MRRSGFRTVSQVAQAIFDTASSAKHAAINHADSKVLRKHLDGFAAWIPNPAGLRQRASCAAERHARVWLQRTLAERAPVWLMPCRLLRRKNIAEALLLTRWLRPEAWLVSTGPVSSAVELPYSRRLAKAARQHGWKLRLAVLDRASQPPSVSELFAASEAILLPSLQEGFGLAYLEAAMHRKPLICRALPNILPDLISFGFRFQYSYADIWIDPQLFDRTAEAHRQRRLFTTWRRQLPSPCRALAHTPFLLLQTRGPVPFNQLTLTAQLEVLSAPPERSWDLCLPLNPFLAHWRRHASEGRLAKTDWPARAARHLGLEACAENFRRLLAQRPRALNDPWAAAAQAQEEFIRHRLAAENLYPLTWNSIT
jgi:hypothetical protein